MSEGARPPDAPLLEKLGHGFEDPALLEKAFTHPSAAWERDGTRGNERLEFLGDAVLDLVIAQLLFQAHPAWREGDLTRARAALVNTASLAERARELGLGSYLVLGRTEERSGGAEKERILAAVFEAVLGALYLDAGLEPVFALVRRAFAEPLARPEVALRRDPKTRFQEWAHAATGETPRYREIADSGVEEADDRFTVAVELADESWGVGRGRTKRRAERRAAEAALRRVEERIG